MPNQPTSFFIVPSFQNAEFQDTNSQGGISFGVGSPSSSNEGALTVLGTGTPRSTTITDLTLRVQDSGSLEQTTFLFKESDKADTLYKGEHDRRQSYLHSTPFPYSHFDDPNYYGYGLALGYTQGNDREFVLIVSTTTLNEIKIAYRNIFSPNLFSVDGGWTQTSINMMTTFKKKVAFSGSIATSQAQLATCTLDNGKALIFVVNNERDIDVYLTSDALNWVLIAENILGRFIDSEISNTTTLFNLCVSSSGNYVKLASTRIFDDDNYIFTITSSDRGFSWNLSDSYVCRAGLSAPIGGDRFTFSLAGIQESGSFILCTTDNTLNIVRTYIGNGSNELSYKSNLAVSYDINQGYSPEIALCKGTDSIVLFMDYIQNPSSWISPPSETGKQISSALAGQKADFNTKGGEQNILELSYNQNFDLSEWYDYGEFPFEYESIGSTTQSFDGSGEQETTTFKAPSQTTAFYSSNNYRFYRFRMIRVGSGMALCAFRRVAKNLPTVGEQTGLIYMRYGGFDHRSIKDFYDTSLTLGQSHPINKHKQTYILYAPEWYAWHGAPAGILYANPNTCWKEVRNLATRKPYADRLMIMTNQINIASFQDLYYEFRSNRGWNGDGINDVEGGYETPIRNWFFDTNNSEYRPITTEPKLGSQYYKWSSGCCIHWCVKVSSSLTTPTTKEGQCGVFLQGYRSKGSNPSTSAGASMNIEVRMFKDEVQIFDYVTNIELATLDLTTTGTNLGTNFFEFRLAFNPLPNSYNTRCVLMARPVGTSSWINTSILNPSIQVINTTTTSKLYQQRIRFGMLRATNLNFSSAGIAHEWKYFRVHPCNDFDTFALAGLNSQRDQVNSFRGYEITNNLIYLQEGQSVLWSGASGAEGDTFTLQPEYANSVKNILHFDSPRQQWRSAGLTSHIQTTFNIPSSNNEIQKDPVSGIGIIGTNATSIELAGSQSSSSGFTTVSTINLERTRGRVVSTHFNQHTFEVQFDGGKIPYAGEFQSGSSEGDRKYYARFGALGGGFGVSQSNNIATNDHHLVLDHYEGSARDKQFIQLKGLDQQADIGVGTTLIIYGDRGYGCFSPLRSNTHYRLRVNGTTTETEGYLYCGSVVVGNTLQINPVLNWQHSVTEESNNTVYRSRSGIEWAYNEGASFRSIQGNIIGDVTEQMRNRLKNTIRRATNFDRRPLYFVLQDGTQDSSMIFYGKVQVGNNDNAGYYYDQLSQQWRSVGNMTLTIIENV
tara:strand:+ start:16973 stop:20659 length:3687 start_codon:yes stop_codon:yes gene_type:complete